MVFDDTYCVLSTRRLESMPFLWGLRSYAQLDCQRVFLSSTLPPCRMTDFCKWFLVPDPLIVREIGTQQGVAFEVRRVPGTVWGIVQAVQEVVETSVELKPEGLVLVYCSGADICVALQEHLRAYVSYDGSILHREQLQAWRAREDPDRVLMACTGDVCEGYHLEGVRVVVNVDYPRGMTEYLQRNARICREGGLGVASSADTCRALFNHCRAYMFFEDFDAREEDLRAWRTRADADRILIACTGCICEDYNLEGVLQPNIADPSMLQQTANLPTLSQFDP
ncbi:hypothetical protein EDC01DRAFT_743851 [Geopyxis carbonaria]|nr:hypothetical protein EDC01DRAFT_743851 [Geopyxis carbonaria]